mgnify:CR=1 FL=1
MDTMALCTGSHCPVPPPTRAHTTHNSPRYGPLFGSPSPVGTELPLFPLDSVHSFFLSTRSHRSRLSPLMCWLCDALAPTCGLCDDDPWAERLRNAAATVTAPESPSKSKIDTWEAKNGLFSEPEQEAKEAEPRRAPERKGTSGTRTGGRRPRSRRRRGRSSSSRAWPRAPSRGCTTRSWRWPTS